MPFSWFGSAIEVHADVMSSRPRQQVAFDHAVEVRLFDDHMSFGTFVDVPHISDGVDRYWSLQALMPPFPEFPPLSSVVNPVTGPLVSSSTGVDSEVGLSQHVSLSWPQSCASS